LGSAAVSRPMSGCCWRLQGHGGRKAGFDVIDGSPTVFSRHGLSAPLRLFARLMSGDRPEETLARRHSAPQHRAENCPVRPVCRGSKRLLTRAAVPGYDPLPPSPCGLGGFTGPVLHGPARLSWPNCFAPPPRLRPSP
jgi:hypothetical protein